MTLSISSVNRHGDNLRSFQIAHRYTEPVLIER